MRVDSVDKSKRVGYIKFNTDTEMDLIAESIDRLIKKQQKHANEDIGKKEKKEEIEKLERYKQSKDAVIEIPRQNKIRMKAITDRIKENIKKDARGIKAGSGEVLDVEDTNEFKASV